MFSLTFVISFVLFSIKSRNISKMLTFRLEIEVREITKMKIKEEFLTTVWKRR
jgi:hypothetical protein